MFYCLTGLELLGFRVERIIEFVYLQYLLPAQNDQRFIERKPEHLIRGQQFAFADRIGLAVFRRIIGDAPGTELLRLTGDANGDIAGSIGNESGCQLIGTPEKELGITVAENLLPLVLRVSILQLRKILEYDGDVQATASHGTDLLAEVRYGTDIGEFVTDKRNGHGQFSSGTVLICIPYQFNEQEREEE